MKRKMKRAHITYDSKTEEFFYTNMKFGRHLVKSEILVKINEVLIGKKIRKKTSYDVTIESDNGKLYHYTLVFS